jgi:hypothetical protein
MPRRGWEEHEADHVGARRERSVKRFGRRKTADFNGDGHALACLQ